MNAYPMIDTSQTTLAAADIAAEIEAQERIDAEIEEFLA